MTPPSLARLLSALVLLLGAAVFVAAQAPTGKTPIPERAAQATAEALVKRIFSEDYTRARSDPAVRLKLLESLRQQADETKDGALRFVLLRETRDLAARAGEVATALRAAGDLAEEFAVDEPRTRAAVLLQAAPAATTARAKRALGRAALELLGQCLEADNPALALELARTATAVTADDAALHAGVEARVAEAHLLAKARDHIKEFVERLKRVPADVDANLAVGSYHALLRGDWAKGLPLLARGPDGDLKALARRELAGPDNANKQVELADSWRLLAKERPGATASNLLLRAGHWYQQAVLLLEGEERARIEDRLRGLVEQLPPGRQLPGYLVQLRRFEGHQGNVTGVAFTHDGRRVLTVSGDHTLRLWDVATGRQRKQFEAHKSWVRAVALSPDVDGGSDRRALTAGDDNLLRLWDLTSGREVRRLKGHSEWVRCVAFLPDGRRAISGSDDGTLRLWDVDSGNPVRRYTGHTGYVMSLAVSADGRRLLSGSADESVRLWDVESGAEQCRLEGHRGCVNAVALSADGRRALSGGADGTVRLWDVARRREVRRFLGHQGSVWSVAFAPDGRMILTGGADRTARLWDVSSGREVRRLRGHTSLVLSVAFGPDGREVLTGSADKTARLWGPPR